VGKDFVEKKKSAKQRGGKAQTLRRGKKWGSDSRPKDVESARGKGGKVRSRLKTGGMQGVFKYPIRRHSIHTRRKPASVRGKWNRINCIVEKGIVVGQTGRIRNRPILGKNLWEKKQKSVNFGESGVIGEGGPVISCCQEEKADPVRSAPRGN